MRRGREKEQTVGEEREGEGGGNSGWQGEEGGGR